MRRPGHSEAPAPMRTIVEDLAAVVDLADVARIRAVVVGAAAGEKRSRRDWKNR